MKSHDSYYLLEKFVGMLGGDQMTPFSYVIISLMIVLMIAAVVVSYRRNRRAIRDFEVFETFEADQQIQLALQLKPWMVSRVERRVRKLGWELIDSSPSGPDCVRALYGKSDDPAAQPLSAVLHQLNRSGFLSGGPLNLRNAQEQTEA